MWASLSYLLVFLLYWWVIFFIIAAILSLLIWKFKLFDYDVFETPILAIPVLIVGFFAAYQFLLVGFDLPPPFFDQPVQNVSANTNVPAQVPSSDKGMSPPNGMANSERESRRLFWIGLVLSLPIGIASSLLASWIHNQVKKT